MAIVDRTPDQAVTQGSASHHTPRALADETLSIIRRKLSYDPETGSIVWIEAPPRRDDLLGKEAGSLHKSGYVYVGVRTNGKTKLHSAHHIAWFLHYGKWPHQAVDHRDGNRRNNRISNLRLSTSSGNCQNRRLSRTNTSGVHGVSWFSKIRKWAVQIRVNDRNIVVGYFVDIEDARRARLDAEAKYHGEFAASARAQLPQT